MTAPTRNRFDSGQGLLHFPEQTKDRGRNMVNKAISLSALMVLVACGGNPFLTPEEFPEPTEELGGTTNPAASRSINRFELRDSVGGGYVTDTDYDSVSGTFTVDGLPFDGINEYNEITVPNVTTPFDLYEPNPIAVDEVNGIPVAVFLHRAVRGQSTSGDTSFAIIRTGQYINFGFGGFVFERNGSVTLPQANGSSSFAVYNGDYAGVRDFTNSGGLEYVTGDMNITIDLGDFDGSGALIGSVTNRQVYDLNGVNVTPQIVAALADDFDNAALTELPAITFTVQENTLTPAGEISGSARSFPINGDGASERWEDGRFYGVISGAGADQEVVGVIVITATDPRFGNAGGTPDPTGGTATVSVRETGGFILYR